MNLKELGMGTELYSAGSGQISMAASSHTVTDITYRKRRKSSYVDVRPSVLQEGQCSVELVCWCNQLASYSHYLPLPGRFVKLPVLAGTKH
jgi:hypothetical protein